MNLDELLTNLDSDRVQDIIRNWTRVEGHTINPLEHSLQLISKPVLFNFSETEIGVGCAGVYDSGLFEAWSEDAEKEYQGLFAKAKHPMLKNLLRGYHDDFLVEYKHFVECIRPLLVQIEEMHEFSGYDGL